MDLIEIELLYQKVVETKRLLKNLDETLLDEEDEKEKEKLIQVAESYSAILTTILFHQQQIPENDISFVHEVIIEIYHFVDHVCEQLSATTY